MSDTRDKLPTDSLQLGLERRGEIDGSLRQEIWANTKSTRMRARSRFRRGSEKQETTVFKTSVNSDSPRIRVAKPK